MKFKTREHNAIKLEIEKSNLAYPEFIFIKKKGWLSIHHSTVSTPFQFYRKTETQLTDAGAWKKHEIFYSKWGKNNENNSQFDGVIASFKLWLNSSRN